MNYPTFEEAIQNNQTTITEENLQIKDIFWEINQPLENAYIYNPDVSGDPYCRLQIPDSLKSQVLDIQEGDQLLLSEFFRGQPSFYVSLENVRTIWDLFELYEKSLQRLLNLENEDDVSLLRSLGKHSKTLKRARRKNKQYKTQKTLRHILGDHTGLGAKWTRTDEGIWYADLAS